MIDEGLRVTVHFGARVPGRSQGPALLAFERHLRELTGLDCRVLKERMEDDSLIRIKMAEKRGNQP